MRKNTIHLQRTVCYWKNSSYTRKANGNGCTEKALCDVGKYLGHTVSIKRESLEMFVSLLIIKNKIVLICITSKLIRNDHTKCQIIPSWINICVRKLNYLSTDYMEKSWSSIADVGT